MRRRRSLKGIIFFFLVASFPFLPVIFAHVLDPIIHHQPTTPAESEQWIRYINHKFRENRPLEWHPVLYEVAKERVKEILESGVYSHAGFRDVARKYGLVVASECLANEYDEKSAIEAWENSPSHRFTMTEFGRYGAIYCERGYCALIIAYDVKASVGK